MPVWVAAQDRPPPLRPPLLRFGKTHKSIVLFLFFDWIFRRSSTCALIAEHRHICNVTDFGAVGDGKTLDTRSINTAVQACHTVVFPAGTYLTGTISLRNNTELVLATATILAAPRGNYEIDNPPPEALACEPGAPYAPACQDYGHSHWADALLTGAMRVAPLASVS